MQATFTLRRVALGLTVLAVANQVIIAATGEMHPAHRYPAWVNAASWIGSVCLLGLGAVAVVAVRRSRFADSLLLRRPGTVLGALTAAVWFAAVLIAQGGLAPHRGGAHHGWPVLVLEGVLVTLGVITFGGLMTIGATRLRQRVAG